jgi:hypothetical protein
MKRISHTKAVLALSLTLTAALLATAPAPASAARGMELAVQDDKVFVVGEPPGVDAGLDKARELGMTTVRALVTWRTALDLHAYDRLVNAASARGMRVQLSLTGMPRWGGSNKVTDTTRPSPRRFARFAAHIARHFRGRVASYSIWNEPNWRTWMVPRRSAPARYRAIYTAAYAAVKKADPSARVLLGELAPHVNPPWSTGPLRFLREMSCQDRRGRRARRCKPIRTDGVALHPYEFRHRPRWRGARTGSVTIGTVGRLTRELRRLGRTRALISSKGGPAPVYLTEFAYFASGKRSTPARLRARWLPQAFELALRTSRVRQMTLFGLFRDPGEKWDVGMIDQLGRHDAAFGSLQRWSSARGRKGLVTTALGTLPSP